MRKHISIGIYIYCFLFPLLPPTFSMWLESPLPATYASYFHCDHNQNRMVAALAGGSIWYSNNGGSSWTFSESFQQLPIQGVEKIQPVGITGDTLGMTFEDSVGVSRFSLSYDAGMNWQIYHSEDIPNYTSLLYAVAENDSRLWAAAGNEYLYFSNDSGATWVRYRFPFNIHAQIYKISFSKDNRSIYLCYNYMRNGNDHYHPGLIRFTIAQQTTEDLCDLYNLFQVELAIIPSFVELTDGRWMVAVSASEWQHTSLLVSDDEGKSWARLENVLPYNFIATEVIEDQTSPGTLFCWGQQALGLYRSMDYGQTWEHCTNGLPEASTYVNMIQQNPLNQRLYVSVEGYGIFWSEDHGDSWHPISLPSLAPWGEFLVTPEFVCNFGVNWRHWTLTSLESEWQEIMIPVEKNFTQQPMPVHFDRNGEMKRFTYRRALSDGNYTFHSQTSLNNGITWETGQALPYTPRSNFDFYFTDSDSLLVAGDNQGQILLSRDWGSTLETVSPVGGNSKYSTFSDLGLISFSSSSIQISQDFGTTWKNTDFPVTPILTTKAFATQADSLFLFHGNQFYVYSPGTGWQAKGAAPVDDYFGVANLLAIPIDGNITFLGRKRLVSTALLHSSDGGNSWTTLDMELPYSGVNYQIGSIAYDRWREVIWASTAVGNCYLPVGELAVSDQSLQFLPTSSLLVETWPNPFNSTATVRYTLPETGLVTVSLYNLAGQLVARLFDGEQERGVHTLSLDGTSLASGSYFLHVATPNTSNSRKVILVK